jgi:hypothetical protein
MNLPGVIVDLPTITPKDEEVSYTATYNSTTLISFRIKLSLKIRIQRLLFKD